MHTYSYSAPAFTHTHLHTHTKSLHIAPHLRDITVHNSNAVHFVCLHVCSLSPYGLPVANKLLWLYLLENILQGAKLYDFSCAVVLLSISC